MLTAQDKAFAAVASQIGLLTPDGLQRAERLREERGQSDPLAQVCAEFAILPAPTVSKVLREVIRAAYLCGGCGSQLGYDQLASLGDLSCPQCGGDLSPQRRKPSGDGLTDGPAPTTIPRAPSSRETRSLFETRADGSDRHAPVEPPGLPREGWDVSETVIEKGGAARLSAERALASHGSSLVKPAASAPRSSPPAGPGAPFDSDPRGGPFGSDPRGGPFGSDPRGGPFGSGPRGTPFDSDPRGYPDPQDVPQVSSPGPQAAPPSTGALRAVDGASQQRLGDYQLLEEIGRGSNGVVYMAKRKGLERRFALKVLLDAEFADEESVKRFQLEAAVASKLNDPGIVSVYDVGRHGSHHYYAMEFCAGQNLHERISKGGHLAPREAAKIISKLARTLHRAHQAGVLHRDLKPANIILAEDHPRITDFGLARDRSLEQSLTKSGDIMGTPYYMAPELIRDGAKNIDHRVDIYALGVVLYECLTGERPFVARSQMLLAQMICQAEPKRPSQVVRGIPSQLDAIVLQAMSKEPRRRYVSMQEFADDLELYLRGDSPRARAPKRAPTPKSKLKLLGQAAAVASALLLPVAVWFGWSARSRSLHQAEVEATLARGDASSDELRRSLDVALANELPELAARAQAALNLAQGREHLERARALLTQADPALEEADLELSKALGLGGDDRDLRSQHGRLVRKGQVLRLVGTARQLARAERYDPAAADAYQRATLLTHDPFDRAELQRERFYYLYLRGRYAEVVALAPRLGELEDEAGARARFVAATALGEVGRAAEAKAPLQALATHDPSSAVGLLAKAHLTLLERRDPRLALEDARAAARLAPDWVPALRTEAELELRTGDDARCRELLRRLEELGPDHPRVLLLRAEFLVSLRRFREAQSPIDRLIRLTEPDPSRAALFMKAKANFELDARAAAEAADRGLEIAPDHVGLRLLRGLLYLRSRDRGRAQQELQAGYATSQEEFEALVSELLKSPGDRARIMRMAQGGGRDRGGRRPRADELDAELRRALEERSAAAPEPARAPLEAALLAAAAGAPWPSVLEQLDRATQAAPDAPVVALERARLAVGRDAYDLALEAIARARTLKAAPRPLLDRLRAEVRLRRGEIQGAREAYEALARRDPKGPEGGCARAEALLASLDRSGAELAAQETLRTYPEHAGSLVVLALATHDPGVADEALRKAYAKGGACDARLILANNFNRLRVFFSRMGTGGVDRRDGFEIMRSTEALFGLTESAMCQVVFLQGVLVAGVPPSPWVDGWLQGHLTSALQREPRRAEAHVVAGLLAVRRQAPAREVLGHWRRARELDPAVQLRRWAPQLTGTYGEDAELKSLLAE